MNAILDVPLSKQLAAGRLFVGQKLRVMSCSLIYFTLFDYNTDNIELFIYVFCRSGEQDCVTRMGQFHPLRFSMAYNYD